MPNIGDRNNLGQNQENSIDKYDQMNNMESEKMEDKRLNYQSKDKWRFMRALRIKKEKVERIKKQ